MKNLLKAGLIVGVLLLSSPVKISAAETLPIDLNQSIKMALMNNRTIEQSAKDRESALWQYSQARRTMGPKLTWNSSLMHIGGRDYSSYREAHDYDSGQYPSYDNEFTNSIGIEMPLYTGGQNESQIDYTRYRINQADLTLENTLQEIKYQTTAAYYQMLQRRALIKVEEESVRTLQEHLDNVNFQFEVGTVAKSDVLASKVQLAARQQSLVTAQGDYSNAMADLSNLIGVPLGTNLAAEEELTYTKYNRSLEECIEYALKNRPGGVAAEYAIKQAEMSIKGAKAGYRPKIAASVNKNIAGEGSFSQNHSESWSAGLSLSWDIFDNGVTSSQVHAAQSELEKIQSQALQMKERIQLEVTKAYTDLISAEKNISTTSETIKIAEEDYFIAQLRYNEGIDTNLSVMDAQKNLTEARTNYYNALYNYNIAVAALDKATGVPIIINVPVYVAAEQNTNSPKKALQKSLINSSEVEVEK